MQPYPYVTNTGLIGSESITFFQQTSRRELEKYCKRGKERKENLE